VLALAITGSTAAEMLGQRFRVYGAPPGQRAADTSHSEPERAARHDALTGLLNDHAFFARFRRILEGRRRGDRCTALLSLDLIDFTAINAAHGAAAGDLLLRHASARLLATLRETDILARLGADEFGGDSERHRASRERRGAVRSTAQIIRGAVRSVRASDLDRRPDRRRRVPGRWR
jgi:GGDEF domain-containing protein